MATNASLGIVQVFSDPVPSFEINDALRELVRRIDDLKGLHGTIQLYSSSVIVEGSSDPSLSFVAQNDVQISRPASRALAVLTNGIERLRISDSGLDLQLGLNLPGGDATDPTYSFLLDGDTGMYRVSANVLGFSTAGVERARLDSTGLLLAGNLLWQSGTSFNGTLDHAITADRTWTYPDRTDTIVLLGGAQTLTDKTLTAPIMSTIGPSASQQHTVPAVTSDTLTLNAATQTLTNKTLTAPIISTLGPSGSQQHTMPAVTSDTVALLAATQTLTNKTVSGGTFSGTIAGAPTLSGSTVTFSNAPTFTGFTPGSLFFAGTSGVLSQDNANLFFDNTNNRLGIGTASPLQTLHVRGGQIALDISQSLVWYDAGLTELNVGVGRSTTSLIAFTNNVTRLTLDVNGSVGINGASFGGGTAVIFIANATANPSANPTGGGILYVTGGALTYRGSSGTVTTIAAA